MENAELGADAGKATRGHGRPPRTASLFSGTQGMKYQLQDGVTAEEESGSSEETPGSLQQASWAARSSPGVGVNLTREQSGGHVQLHGREGMGQADARISPGVGASSAECDKARQW